MLVAKQLHVLRGAHPGRPVLVDAHAVIDNDRELVRVPLEAVRAMQPNGLALLEAPPETLAIRRRESHRLRPSRTIQEIAAEMDAERDAVRGYAAVLGIRLMVATTTVPFEFDEMIAALRQPLM